MYLVVLVRNRRLDSDHTWAELMMSILGSHLFNLCRFVRLEYMDVIVFSFTSQKLCNQVLNCYDLGFCKRIGGGQLVMLIPMSTGTVTFYFFPQILSKNSFKYGLISPKNFSATVTRGIYTATYI